MNPSFQKAHYNLGIALEKQGRTDEAIRHYQEALRISPNYARAHAFYSLFLSIMGRTDEALPYIERALELDPLNTLYHGLYGISPLYQTRPGIREASLFRQVSDVEPH